MHETDANGEEFRFEQPNNFLQRAERNDPPKRSELTIISGRNKDNKRTIKMTGGGRKEVLQVGLAQIETKKEKRQQENDQDDGKKTHESAECQTRKDRNSEEKGQQENHLDYGKRTHENAACQTRTDRKQSGTPSIPWPRCCSEPGLRLKKEGQIRFAKYERH